MAAMDEKLPPAQQEQQGNIIQQILGLLNDKLGSGKQPMTTMGTQAPQYNPQPQYRQPQANYPTPQGGFGTVGERKRAQRQALMQTVAGTVKSAVDYHQQRKIRASQMDFERIFSAMDGLKEAEASGDKDAIEHNRQIINDMMSDPKKIKALQKALNINLLGDSKDQNSPEHKGFIEAYKKYQSGESKLNPYAQMLMKSQPQRTQLNPALQAQAAAVKAGLIPDANTTLQAGVTGADRASQNATQIQVQKMKDETDLKVAEMTAGVVSAGGVNVVDPKSITGISHVQRSPDGKNIRVTPDVVLPGVLPSTHQGETTLTLPDPEDPTKTLIVRIPTQSATQKSIPGVGTVGNGGVVNKGISMKTPASGGQGQVNVDNTDKSRERKMGLPPGSHIIGVKALSGQQIISLKEGVTTMESTVEVLKKLRANTKVYADMVKAGRIKLVTDQKTGKRILGGFIPATKEEEMAASYWNQSAEYMNIFRKGLSAQGFRSIPAYDNMLALRGQLWQSETTLNTTLDDSIKFLQKQIETKKHLLGEVDKVTEEDKTKDTGEMDFIPGKGLVPHKAN